MKSRLREIDLYAPLEKFLTEHGYIVHAEVVLSDISATKEGVLLVVEVKLRFNLDVILQAIERQRAADAVYIAIPIHNFRRHPRRWKAIRSLCSRLGIGILFVRFVEGRAPEVEVALHRRDVSKGNSKAKLLFLKEIEGRGTNRNIGGSSRVPLYTAYRKEALRIAQCLVEHGPLSPQQLRALGCVPSTGSILLKNYYGWFERISRGVYQLNEKGKKALEAYQAASSR
ncbi:MAG: DUF2161 family putative PD-(D/E)XK-type phosphodiesterase [Spirochaetes bacterium]|nr:DUF2161 family putative PD-(D/E)XK-type phosphodiesterase [Spirochaetota bacterium]